LLTEKIDRYNLRKHIQFSTKVVTARWSDVDKIWTITTADGKSTTCRYFIPATGILSVPKDPPFPGLKSYTGAWYQSSIWPEHKVDFHGKRIAIVGTGSTGVHLVPKLAPVAKELTVFQRTPNYVLPGRNYPIDEYQAADIKNKFDETWEIANANLAGHAVKPSGRTVKAVGDSEKIRQILDHGWESGCFNFQLGTFDDTFMDPEANEVVSEYVRQKIRAIVQDPETAELLCPKYPFGAKRPPSGHFYYEAFNRPNVKLVDISQAEIDLYEKGIRTSSGVKYEFDIIIFALGFDAGTGALKDMDIRGSQDKSLREYWTERLGTFAGILVPTFPNMFIVMGPHMPAGNMPIPLEIAVDWIGKTIRHMEENHLGTIDVAYAAADAWSSHHDGLWNSVFISKPATDNRSWFVDTKVPGKPPKIMFYFGGTPNWRPWLDKEIETGWTSMEFTTRPVTNGASKDASAQDTQAGGLSVTAEQLESVVIPLQSDHVGISAGEKFNLTSAATARYIDWAVKEMHDRGLSPKPDYRVHWWKALQDFVNSDSGRAIVEQAPTAKDELDQLTSKLGVEGEAVARIGPEIVRLLTGQAHPLSLILKDDLLFRMYLSDEGARPNRYAAEYAKILASQRQDLRILEIGGGTGGTTFQVLSACSPDGQPFCSEYVFTDISPGFFKTCRTTLKKWEHLLTFKTLNVENNPVKQGFEAHGYDLIIAANVVHATKSLNKSLGTIHTLLKPGGVLALVELTRLTPYFNMAFGPLSGWWLGVDEGRTGSPLLSADQWAGQLRRAGFSGVDLAAYDLPEPERHSALLLSTALAGEVRANGH
jgi:cation diffusion facilitator CzcD-associated flavoprotein CzcO/SAM-dependent methyltransferase